MNIKKSINSGIKFLDKNKKVRMYACPMGDDEKMMMLALEQAQMAAAEGEVPVGAVLALGDRILAAAHNRPISLLDPSAHAEMLAIRHGAAALKNYRLSNTTLYVTLEPCLMCTGLLVQARIGRLVFGAADPKSGAVASLFQILEDRRLNHSVTVTGGILKEACAEILSGFFQEKRLLSRPRSGMEESGEVPKWS
jgi:tRNA(adenine34) deaminase